MHVFEYPDIHIQRSKIEEKKLHLLGVIPNKLI